MTSPKPSPSRSRSRSRRLKVLLYSPKAVFYTLPLALVAVGSHLDSRRFEVVILDGRLDGADARLDKHLEDALCLGVSVLTGDPIRDALAVCRRVRQRRPDLPIVWGGWHPSLFPRQGLEPGPRGEAPPADVTVQGQGEETFAEIVRRLAAKQSLEGCAGCTVRGAGGEVTVNPPRPFVDVNRLRRHDYGLLDVERYFQLKGKRQLDYVSSQGCPFRCAFCADPFVYQRQWKGLEPERVGSEVEALWHRHRFEDLSFQDETYFTYPKRVAAVAEEFLRRGLPITWAATLRADQCQRLPEEVFALCRRSGLRRVLVGVEAGSQEMLDRIKKDIRIEQVFFAAERCQRHGVAAIFPCIVGFPGEPPESVEATLRVARQLRAMSPAFETPIFYFKPYPGSTLTTEAVAGGFQLPATLEAWADFDFIGSAGPWVSPQLYRRVERFKFYQRLGWSEPRPWKRPLQAVARWRCQNHRYALPVEKVVSNLLWPQPALS